MTGFADVASRLAPFDVSLLDSDASTIYAVDDELRIGYVNHAWLDFARANGAQWRAGEWGVGTRVLDAVPEVLRPFYAELFESARRARAPVEHSYECSTPTRLRHYRMRILPCAADTLLVVHSLADDSPHSPPDGPESDRLYRDAGGLLAQCSHCRRVRRVESKAERWDWVAAYVENVPARTSHGLCAICLDYYYPKPTHKGRRAR